MKFCVLVTSYNRPVLLRRLLLDLAAPTSHEVHVKVYDDASCQDMTAPRRVIEDQNWSWISAPERYGKRSWWRWLNQIYKVDVDAHDYFVVLPDDMRLCDGFFDRALVHWKGIKDDRKIALNLHRDSRKDCWIKGTRAPSSDGRSEHSGWVDHAFLATRDYFSALDFEIHPVPDPIANNPNRSSGVYQQVSRRLTQKGLRCYAVRQSLLAHGMGVSKMHPEHRKDVPLRTVSYADGDTALLVAENPDQVSVSIATMPEREDTLRIVVNDLLPQVDRVCVFLNGHKSVPTFLQRSEIDTASSKDFGDLADSGKFFFAEFGYRLTADDDIVYPKDYVKVLLRAVERHRRRTFVGVHGGHFVEPFWSYY